jgi:hypothetical protein
VNAITRQMLFTHHTMNLVLAQQCHGIKNLPTGDQQRKTDRNHQ